MEKESVLTLKIEEEFSDLFAEIENYETLPILLKNNNYNFEILSQELNECENEMEKIKVKESELKGNVEYLSSLLEKKLNENKQQTHLIEEIKSCIKNFENLDYSSMIETDKKILNSYKYFLKLKWLYNTSNNKLEALIFNDKTTYLNYNAFDKTDPLLQKKIWTEISNACDNSWKILF